MIARMALVVLTVLSLTATVSADEADLAKLQGSWQGADADPKIRVSFDKKRAEFHSSTGEWYKGSFEIDAAASPKRIVVTIDDCPVEEFQGKTSLGIYQVTDGQLVIAACRPGVGDAPKGFDDERCRVVNLVKDK